MLIGWLIAGSGLALIIHLSSVYCAAVRGDDTVLLVLR